MKRAAIAIDWSIRPKVLLTKPASSEISSARSASTQIEAIISTVSTGYLPAAVSALSITASVPSSTALATSLTSARVGTGLTIIDSIICVAVIVKRSISRASLIIRFCSAGTAALPTSTARSPRATMIPSDALRIDSSAGIASVRSIFAMRWVLCLYGSPATLASWRAISMSVAFFGKLTARVLALEGHRGLDVLHVLGRQGRRRQAAAGLVDALVVRQLAADHDDGVHLLAADQLDRQAQQAVVEQQRVAGADVARQVLVVEADALARAQAGVGGVEHQLAAGHEHRLAALELADADLGPLQVRHDRDLLADLLRDLLHQGGAVDVVLCHAVREVEPDAVDAGADDAFEHLRRARRRPEGGDDLGFADAGDVHQRPPRPRRSRISIAGSALPSSISRNAPPPVEM